MDPRPIRTVAIIDFVGFIHDFVSTLFRMPRLGPVLIGTILNERGHHVRVFSETVRPLDADALGFILTADVVAMSVLTFGAGRAYAIAALVRQHNPRAVIVMGDVHPSIMPEHALAHCDYAVRDEGDETVVELFQALEGAPGAPRLEDIRGLSFWRDGKTVHNEKRERNKNIDSVADMSLIEGFIQSDLLTFARQRKVTMAVVQASRGCPVACKFCIGSAILGVDYRTRDIEHVIEQLHQIRRQSGDDQRVVYFVDNHFFIDKKWTVALLRRIIEERFRLRFIAFAQYMIGYHPEVLDLLREANFKRIFVGFESLNPKTLEQFKRKQNEAAMRECVASMHAHGVYARAPATSRHQHAALSRSRGMSAEKLSPANQRSRT